MHVALITQSTQHDWVGAGQCFSTPDALATHGLCLELCVQRRVLLSLAAEPVLFWRWSQEPALGQLSSTEPDLAWNWSF